MSERDGNLGSGSLDAVTERTDELSSLLEHPEENRLKMWFLLTGRRMAVTAVILAAVFAIIIGASLLQPLNVRGLLNETNTVKTLFTTLLSGAILLVSIVVSISSIVLSQEITDISSQQERVTATIEYRKRVEQFINADITPARPAEFLRAVLHTIFRNTQALDQIASESSDEEFRTHVDEFFDNVTSEIEEARDTLGDARFGTFRVLLVGLDYNYAGQLHVARGFKRRYGDTLSDKEEEVIDELISTLKFFATGREYFKSLYYKREFARLSSRLLYVSLPVIVFISYILLALDENLFPRVSLFSLSPLLVFVSFAYTVALAPYVVLTSYILRAATITLRTLAAGPFILQPGEGIEDLDWELPENLHDWEITETTGDDD